MSYCTSAISAMENDVIAPITMTNDSAASESSKSGDIRATMKMPAVTMVAAWISAELGGGPSIEPRRHAEDEPEVADAVDDERLQVRVDRRRTLVPEPDQQVGHQTDRLPAEEELQEVVGHHQHQH